MSPHFLQGHMPEVSRAKHADEEMPLRSSPGQPGNHSSILSSTSDSIAEPPSIRELPSIGFNRTSTQSSSSSSNQSLGESIDNPKHFYLHVQDFDDFLNGQARKPERKPTIEEPVSELVAISSEAPSAYHVDQNTPIAFSPLLRRDVPEIESGLAPGNRTDPSGSEITDLGAELYQIHESEHRTVATEPVDSLSTVAPSRQHESLQNLIFGARCTPRAEEQGFFPMGKLETLIREDVVVQELTKALASKHSTEMIRVFAQKICAARTGERTKKRKRTTRRPKCYQKVFALLVLVKRLDIMDKVLDDAEGMHDGDLPLYKVQRDGIPGFSELRRHESGPSLACFGPLSDLDIFNFEKWQWSFLAPFFSRGRQNKVKKYLLWDRNILPFTTVDSIKHEGGFGKVVKVDIHPDHHNFRDTKKQSTSFAVKRLDSSRMAMFKQEFEMLAQFSDDAHPHLISLLAAYKQNGNFHLIFHWADANLYDYWKTVNRSPEFDKDTVVWVAEQCAGLAGGLLKIHHYESSYDCKGKPRSDAASNHLRVPNDSDPNKLYGRHGDVKPQNLLWFRSPSDANDKGQLKIADFGLAEVHHLESRSGLSKSRVGTSPIYSPPEYVLPNGKISRSYDIWTLGCLYLEFIAWLLGGFNCLKTFTIKRGRSKKDEMALLGFMDNNFFDLQNGGTVARVKPEVVAFINQLHEHESCSEYIHDFLDLIEDEMLLVETNTTRRIDCGPLQLRLRKMHGDCLEKKGYAMAPVPRNRQPAV